MIDFEHVNILKSHLLFDLCGKAQTIFPSHLSLDQLKQTQSNLFANSRENPIGDEFKSSTPQPTMPFSSSPSTISSSQSFHFFNNYFNQLANRATCNKVSAFSPIDLKKKDAKIQKPNESHLMRNKTHDENEHETQLHKSISNKNIIKTEQISSRSSTTSSPTFSTNALYSPVNKSHTSIKSSSQTNFDMSSTHVTNVHTRTSENNSYSSPSSSSTSSTSASSSSTISSLSSSFKQVSKRKLTNSMEKCSDLAQSKHSSNENVNEHELDNQMANTSKNLGRNSLLSSNTNNNNNKMMKNSGGAGGGIDWKITMLDGTQTVELNMADELGKQKKTHVCLFCGKIYNRKYGLKIHLRTHTGYKPLKCKVCLRPFSDPSNLNKHVRLHSQGETPYRCPYCDKILVRKRDLDRHILSRHSSSHANLLDTTDKMNNEQNEYEMSDCFEQSSSSYVLSTSQQKIEPNFN